MAEVIEVPMDRPRVKPEHAPYRISGGRIRELLVSRSRGFLTPAKALANRK